MKLRISHSTRYGYDQPVYYALQQLRLTPVSNSQQTVLDWHMEVDGGEVELSFSDHFGNQTTLVRVNPEREHISVSVSGEVETNDTSGVLGKVYGRAPLWLYTQETARTKSGRGIAKLSRILGQGDSMLDNLHELSREILATVPYDKSVTFSETSAEEALSAGGGVCQDHAQIFIAAARRAGIPARYVSGYLMMNDRVDQDASHAWAEAHIDGLGWVGFDISNGISPDERYVRLATGLDSRDSSPISGIRHGDARESMIVSLQVQQ